MYFICCVTTGRNPRTGIKPGFIYIYVVSRYGRHGRAGTAPNRNRKFLFLETIKGRVIVLICLSYRRAFFGNTCIETFSSSLTLLTWHRADLASRVPAQSAGNREQLPSYNQQPTSNRISIYALHLP